MRQMTASPELQQKLVDLRRQDAGATVDAAAVVPIVEEVIATLAGDLTVADLKLYNELEALARFIQNAKAEIAAVRVEAISSEDIPNATDELDAVVGATEEATGIILDCAETLESLAGRMDESTAETVQRVVTRIYEACNFQDITGQRITKVVKTLKHIEGRVRAMLGAFGEELAAAGGQGQALQDMPVQHPASAVSSVPPAGVGGDADLLNGPQLPDDAKKQAEIDAILASFN